MDILGVIVDYRLVPDTFCLSEGACCLLKEIRQKRARNKTSYMLAKPL